MRGWSKILHANTELGEVFIESLSALTLATSDMRRAVKFYEKLGFELAKGGPSDLFVTFRAGSQYLNITLEAPEREPCWWGRAIFYVNNVDAMYERVLGLELEPDFAPRDAPWGERYFHMSDPDGHELSFARRKS